MIPAKLRAAIEQFFADLERAGWPKEGFDVIESLLLCPKRDRSSFSLALYGLRPRHAFVLRRVLEHKDGLVTGDWRRAILSAKLQELEVAAGKEGR